MIQVVQLIKRSDETVSQWYARVKSLALKCKFSALDEYVRDRFIIGMVDNDKLFDKMCEEDERLDLPTALKKALLQETKMKGKAMSSDVNFVRGGQQRSASQITKSSNSTSNNNNNNSNHTGRSRTPYRHCGWKSHQSGSCKFKEAICRSCGKKGHLSPICRNKDKKANNFIDLHTPQTKINCISNEFLNFSNTGNNARVTSARANGNNEIFSISKVSDSGVASKSFRLTVSINGIQFDEVKCDTGAPCSLISIGMFDKFFDRKLLKIRRNDFTDYGGHPLSYFADFEASVMYRNECVKVTFIITKASQPILLGESFLNPFRFRLLQVNAISMNNKDFIVDKIKSEFSDVFKSELGRFSGAKVHLELKSDATPKFFKPRAVPLAWKSKIENKLKELRDIGMLEPIDNSEWGTPIVPIVKSTGDLRICGDYKVTLNQFLVDFKYPLPRIEEIFASLVVNYLQNWIYLTHTIS